MTESPFEFFSKLIDRQAAIQQLRRCDCGRRPVLLQDPLTPQWWVSCPISVEGSNLVGCGVGYFAPTEQQAMQKWQENADNKQ